MKVLVTGASGFIGRALIDSLLAETEYELSAAVRSNFNVSKVTSHTVEDINGDTDWVAALVGVDVVVHLAARAHVFLEKANDELNLLREINTVGTRNLAEQAIKAGVKRFIFLSSIGVNGSSTPRNYAFQESSPINPETCYAQSKAEAELELINLDNNQTMDIVIIRSPLVYSELAPGSFRTLLNATLKGIPLPFKHLNNRKSFISINNLVNFIELCISHPQAADQLFLVSDDNDLSVAEIVKFLSKGMGRKERLFFLPSFLIKIIARIIGKEKMYIQIYESLQVCPDKAKFILQWKPQESFSEALIRTGKKFCAKRSD